MSDADITFFGGLAGVGKSFMLNLKKLQNLCYPNFTGATFRRSSKAFDAGGSIWQEAVQMFNPLKPRVNRAIHRFEFPNNVTLDYSHLQYEQTVYNHQGSQFARIDFDELTHFTEFQVIYMLSRNRPLLTCTAPAQVAATMNPDADSWVRNWVDWYIDDDGFAMWDRSGIKRWFIRRDDEQLWFDSYESAMTYITKNKLIDIPKSFTFIPARREDNKLFFESESGHKYLSNLQSMTSVERARLLEGNWNIKYTKGSLFKKDWLPIEIISEDLQFDAVYRGWDLAATVNKNSDWSATTKIGKIGNTFYILDYQRYKRTPAQLLEVIRMTAEKDGVLVKQVFEQEGGSSAIFQKHAILDLLREYQVQFIKPMKNKTERAGAFSVACENKNVYVNDKELKADYIKEFLEFPEGQHDDMVDATTLAYNAIKSVQTETYFG